MALSIYLLKQSNSESARALLQRALGAEVRDFLSHPELLEAASKKAPDLILSGWYGVDAPALLRAIKSHSATEEIPVILWPSLPFDVAPSDGAYQFDAQVPVQDIYLLGRTISELLPNAQVPEKLLRQRPSSTDA